MATVELKCVQSNSPGTSHTHTLYFFAVMSCFTAAAAAVVTRHTTTNRRQLCVYQTVCLHWNAWFDIEALVLRLISSCWCAVSFFLSHLFIFSLTLSIVNTLDYTD